MGIKYCDLRVQEGKKLLPRQCWLGYASGGRNVLKHSSNPLGGLFVPFAFGLDYTGFHTLLIVYPRNKMYWGHIRFVKGVSS